LKRKGVDDENEVIKQKKQELEKIQNKIKHRQKEISSMRRQLEGSYNIDKIISLEDEVKNKTRILKELKEENQCLIAVQREQEKALQNMKKDYELDDKISELNDQLKQAKERLRNLQFKQRQEERLLKQQHEQAIVLKERVHRMEQLVKDHKKRKAEQKPVVKEVNEEELQELQEQVKEIEAKKVAEEK
jgi:chromosome segregation ATPase